MKEKIPTTKAIVRAYNLLVRHIDDDARDNDEDRAYGGMIRSGKGKLVEGMAKSLLQIAWQQLGGEAEQLSFERQSICISIKNRDEYLKRIQNEEVRNYIRHNFDKYVYKFKTDIHAHIDNKLVLGVECKAYAENAMLKRILVDFTFLKQAYPNAHAVLLQLESQLGGDYSDMNKEIHCGSFPTHTILSYFDVDLHIITLLEGDRKVDRPIHKKAFYKELREESVVNAVEVFKGLLKT